MTAILRCQLGNKRRLPQGDKTVLRAQSGQTTKVSVDDDQLISCTPGYVVDIESPGGMCCAGNIEAIDLSDYELWIAGPSDPRYTPTLETQAQRLGLANRVQFLNYVPYSQLPILLNQAVALVFPSLWEGFGLPALEAMACGTPVIASNLASIPEVTGEAALLIDPTCEAALTDAMIQVIQDAQLQEHLKRAGLERATQFSWRQTGQMTTALLQDYL